MGNRTSDVLAALTLTVAWIAVVPLGALAETQAGPWRLRRQILVDEKAWGWNWATWDQEKIVTSGQYQYSVYWDADKVLVLVRRDLRDDAVQTLRLPKFTLRNSDAHRNTCLGVSAADGRLHLSWDHHNNPLRYTKSRPGFLTDPPARITAGDIEPQQSMLADAKLEARITYPRFIMDRRGELLLLYRVGGSGNGDHFLHRYDPKRGSWTRVGMVFSRRGTYAHWDKSTSRCAYPHDVIFDRRNRLHVTWVYREAGRTWASNHDLHYAYSDDGGLTWQNNAGRKIADLAADDPIELADRGIVVRAIPVFSWVMNASCMALDSKDRPHVVTYKSAAVQRPEKLEHSPPPEIRNRQQFYHYWRDDDGTWRGGEPIDPGGTLTRRPDVVFDARDTLYFLFSTQKGIRCIQASAADRWRTWTRSMLPGPTLTANDASKHDRVRLRKEGILSFTARPKPNSFAIADFVLKTSP